MIKNKNRKIDWQKCHFLIILVVRTMSSECEIIKVDISNEDILKGILNFLVNKLV